MSLIKYIESLDDTTPFINICDQVRELLINKESSKSDMIYLDILHRLNSNLNIERIRLQKKRYIVDKDTVCYVCNKKIQSNIVFRTKADQIMHIYHDVDY